ncbi:MAG: SDR family NAD(P)-dependent oxidoreductase, partial [Burkholderiaceae bacterium]
MAYLDQLFSLSGHRAIVTGASSGLGREMAKALSRAGAEIVLVARRMDALEMLAEEIISEGGKAECFA